MRDRPPPPPRIHAATARRDGAQELARGARLAAPLALAVVVNGAAFAAVARATGMDVLPALVMSATAFSGSAQFAAVSLLGAGAGVISAVLAALLVNARSLALGAAVAPSLDRGWRRILQGLLTVDESWALSHVGGGRYDAHRLVGAGLVVYGAWVAGTALGLLLVRGGGDLLSDPRRLGLDAAFPVLFLALLLPQLGARPARRAAAWGAGLALVLVPWTPAGVPLLASAMGAVAALRRP